MLNQEQVVEVAHRAYVAGVEDASNHKTLPSRDRARGVLFGFLESIKPIDPRSPSIGELWESKRGNETVFVEKVEGNTIKLFDDKDAEIQAILEIPLDKFLAAYRLVF